MVRGGASTGIGDNTSVGFVEEVRKEMAAVHGVVDHVVVEHHAGEAKQRIIIPSCFFILGGGGLRRDDRIGHWFCCDGSICSTMIIVKRAIRL